MPEAQRTQIKIVATISHELNQLINFKHMENQTDKEIIPSGELFKSL